MPGNRLWERADKYADIAQLVEQLIRNQQAKSSNLFVGSIENPGVIVKAITPFPSFADK